MKSLVRNQKCVISILLTVLIVLGMYNTGYGQARDVGEPRTVRLFYLLPNDRPYRQEVVDAMKTGMLDLQSLFAEQMATHGYGNMSFQIETDAQGDPVVHRVDGDHPNRWYVSQIRTDGEIERAFDNSKNIILIVVDSTGESIRGVGAGDKINGFAMIFGEWNWFTAAHELGHAFGLHHDLRDKADILGISGWRDRSSAKLSAGAAGWLSVHPYFNATIPLRVGSKPTLEFISETKYPLGVESVPIRVRVRDDVGLHQVVLLAPIRGLLGVGEGVKEYRKLSGETDTIVEFSYDGLPPVDRWYGAHRTSLSDPMWHSIAFRVIDTEGNSYGHVSGYSIFTLEAVQATINPVSERTPQVRDAIVAAAGINSAADVTEAHLAAITSLGLSYDGITTLKSGDFDGLTALNFLDLGGNNLSSLPEGVFNGLTALEVLNLAGNALSSLPEDVFDGLTALSELDLFRNALSSLPEDVFDGLTALTSLNLSDNALSSLPEDVFDGLTALTRILLYENALSSLPEDVFDGLTALTSLNLRANNLSSLPDGVFGGLTALTHLDLSGNTVDRLALIVSLQKVTDGQFKAVAPAGAPFDIVVSIAITNSSRNAGQISRSVTTATIPTGSTESETLTVPRTTAHRTTAHIESLSAPPESQGGYYLSTFTRFFNPLVLFDDASIQINTLISNRTPQVRDAIVRAAGVNSAADVTEAHLAAITRLTPRNSGITALKTGDFDGLSGLTHLVLESNQLTTLPIDIFDGLTALTWFDLSDNQFTSLPSDIFNGLSALTSLDLSGNQFTTLPEDIFDGLAALRTLDLQNNQLTTLPAGIFDGLSSLNLGLSSNQLRSLPEGFFSGLSSLTSLNLSQYPLDPLPLTVSLEKVADGQFKAVAPAGAPFDIVVSIAITNISRNAGQISRSVTTATIPTGSTESETLTVPRTTAYRVTAEIELLPALPESQDGYYLSAFTSFSNPLVLFDDASIQIWSGTITYGTWGNAFGNGNATGFGYSRLHNAGAISNPTFTYRGTTYTINGFGFAKVGNGPAYEFVLTISPRFPACDKKLLNFGSFRLSEALNGLSYSDHTYHWHGSWAIWEPIGQQRSYSINLYPTAPDAPVVTATNAGNQVTLSWETPCDGGVDITGHAYRQRIGTGAFGAWIRIPNSAAGEVNAASYVITNVNNPLESTFQVRAVNGFGTSTPSAGTTPINTLISNRTPQVRDAIVRAAGVNSAADVTEAHLAAITSLNLVGITSLKSGDFDGLLTLTELLLGGNQLSTLPSGVFSGLSALKNLGLGGNQLSTLPSGVFSELSALTRLYLGENQLSTLPSGVFSGLSALTELSLGDNRLSTLPSGVFSELSALTELTLSNNGLTTLPEGVFSGLSSGLTHLWLIGNSVNPLPLTISLEKVAEGQFKAVAPTGAPFRLVLPMTMTNGSISGGATSVTIPAGSVESDTLTVTRTPGTTDPVTVDIGSPLPRFPSQHAGYTLVKSTDLPLEVISAQANRAPVFTDGTTATRTIAENTAANTNIGTAIAATDADTGDTLTYTLSGADAAAFRIDSATGQLRTKAALDYETKRTYTVSVSVSDGSLTDTIAVTISVTDVDERPPRDPARTDSEGTPEPTNNGPMFTEGVSTTRTIAENTASGVNIGTAIAATDADNDTLTYTLSGTDAAAFSIVSTTGQLQTKAALDYETKATYTVTITVSDGSLTDTITVTINITDIAETEVASTEQPIVTAGTATLTASTAVPLGAAILDKSVVTLTLTGRKYARSIFNIRDAVSVSGISGVTIPWHQPKRKNDTELTVELEFDGNINTDGTLTFTVGADAIADYNGPALTAQVPVSAGDAPSDTGGQNPDPPETPEQPGDEDPPEQPINTAGTPTLKASTAAPLTEATLHGGVITLNLSGDIFESSSFRIRNAVSISGITGVDVKSFGGERISDTQATIELEYEGNMTANGILTISLEAGAIKDYNGAGLTAQIPVTANTEAVVASTAAPLTEGTLDENVVTLTLTGRKYARSIWDIRGAVSISGISGVTIPWNQPKRKNDTELTVELEFDGNMNTDGTLTFTVGADAIAGYNGAALTAQVTVSAGDAPSDTGGQNPDPPETPEQPGDEDPPEQPINTAGTPTLKASTAAPLTEATLHGGVITLNLSGGIFESSSFRIRNAVSVSGITGVDVKSFGGERISDTQATIELEYEGNMTANGILTISLEAGAIKDYDGAALTTQIPVTAVSESVTASTAAPLTEATLDESIITLTLSGRKFERWNSTIRSAVSVTGISGVTVRSFDIDRESDTEVTVELTFNGDMTANGTLTLIVGAGAIAGYNGPALTAQVAVSAGATPADTGEQNPDPPETPQQPETPEQPQQPVNTGGTTLSVSTAAPLTEATLHGSVVTLTLSEKKFERTRANIREAVSVSGIDGVSVDYTDIDRKSDTEVTVELTFAGNLITDGTLTLAVGAAAIVDYNEAFIFQLPVTAVEESITASTETPLTEATLHGNIITLTLNGRKFERTWQKIRDAVSVSGIAGVTVDQYDIDRQSDTEVTVELTFDGDFDADTILTFNIGRDAIAGYDGPPLTTQISVPGGHESITASTKAPLTEATLNGRTVTLTLSGRIYASSGSKIRSAVSVSGIPGVTIRPPEEDCLFFGFLCGTTYYVRRVSDTEVTVTLEFEGDIDRDGTLTFTVGADAIAGYNGAALTAQVTVTADRENALLANFPNPFNPETWIPYQLAKPTEVTITIYAVNGQAVRKLELGHQPAGTYQTRSRAAYWDGRNEFGEPVASGLYFYTLTASDFAATRKMLIRK